MHMSFSAGFILPSVCVHKISERADDVRKLLDFACYVMKEFVQIYVEKGSVFEKLLLLS